jgi:nucleotide-binding universal stress UspA family protein
MSRAILHATDFSPASRAAFAKAVAFAWRDRASLLIAHVMTPPLPVMGDGAMTPATRDALVTGYRKASQKKLDALLRRARAAGARARGLLLEGVPADAIIRTARGRRVGTIMMGTHGRTGVARFFLGSVAGRVVASAPCAVLTVRGR